MDSFVFALIFVAAVGLGPFAGVLGIALHRAGSIARLWAEAIETTDMGPVEAARMSGAGRLKVFVHVQLPDALPQLSSILLYMWDFNVRSSTVLGVVGAGGIGQELTNSVNLLLFDRVLTIRVIILVMVTLIDQLSAWLRRRLS
ncbi:MAG: ABC transporter permease subunit [Methylobacterium sp.]|nr:ABC transporter permease subunit [Methylobacterium sp.]MCA3638410.1 ABC transporter permease subunit [Methylobacterium sp.]